MFNIDRHQLQIEGVLATELAKTYGTPLYVYSETKLLSQLNIIESAFLSKYPNTHAAYACKAFCTKYICKLLEDKGFWLDVVSGGELFTAMAASFPADRIEFNGNNKSSEELVMALEYGVARIVVDNLDELSHLEALCKSHNKTTKILFRITPEVKATTHDYISTGQKDSKFGIPLDESILFPAIERAIKSEVLEFLGFHFHVGSQLQEVQTHINALEVALKLLLETKKRFGYSVKDLNVGGGFGIRYTEADDPLVLSDFLDPIMERVESYCEEHQLVRPHISIEPGRFIVGESGVQLYTIGNIKEIPNTRTYVSVDGGMTDNIRPGLYGANYHALIANKADLPKTSLVTISGKCCESTDILIKDLYLPKPERNDVLVVFSTGAYGYSMANNYNKLQIPAVVVVNGNEHRLIVKRQSYEAMIANEV